MVAFTEAESLKATFVIFIIGLVGVLVNIYVLRAVVRHKIFSYAFGAGCVSHTIANLGITATFAFVVVPITLIDPTWHRDFFLGRSGHLNVFFYFLSGSAHLFVAINRFAIMFFPVRYSQMFTKRNCNIMIAGIWIFAFLVASPNAWSECLPYFSAEEMAFLVAPTTCGYVAVVYMCHHFTILLVCVIACLNMCTFYKIRKIKKSGVQQNSIARRGREVRFFFQAVAQGINFVIELILYFELSPHVNNKWLHFAMTTVAWISVHTIDGFIVIAFNKRMWHSEVVQSSGGAYAVPTVPRTSSNQLS